MGNQIDIIHKLLLELAKEVKRICDENSIDYSLEGGSLLGAVRHKGYIPWDDDFDLFMTRENYDKFLVLSKNQLNSKYTLVTYTNTSKFPFAFSKVMINDVDISHKDRDFPYIPKLHLDILPFDYVPESKRSRVIQKYSAIMFKNILIIKDGGQLKQQSSIPKKMVYHLIKKISVLIPQAYLVTLSEKNLRKWNGTSNMAIMMGVYGYNKTMLPSNILDKYIELPFEDTSFKCIENYDLYLRQLYGDYMILPPEENRVDHGVILLNNH